MSYLRFKAPSNTLDSLAYYMYPWNEEHLEHTKDKPEAKDPLYYNSLVFYLNLGTTEYTGMTLCEFFWKIDQQFLQQVLFRVIMRTHERTLGLTIIKHLLSVQLFDKLLGDANTANRLTTTHKAAACALTEIVHVKIDYHLTKYIKYPSQW